MAYNEILANRIRERLAGNSGMKTNNEFDFWINLAFGTNKIAKSSKRKK
jgi:hypothetical protein